MTFFSKIKSSLSKSASKLTDGISSIFTKKKLDHAMLEELEDLLISTDLGAENASNFISILAKEKFNKEVTTEEVKEFLANYIEKTLSTSYNPLISAPHVILVCGVNGSGKTTTIGKMAHKFKSMGKKVAIAACDTFRAAAVDQLKIWAERVKADFIEGEENVDPASVAFQAVTLAKNNNIDVLFIDTAGRLHNKANLMEELAKINRVIQKVIIDAPHEVWLVLDATIGQNAVKQLEEFNKIVKITGIIITKLDGTAKAGIVALLSSKYQLPIVAIGVGEGIEDLKEFSSSEFARNLLNIN